MIYRVRSWSSEPKNERKYHFTAKCNNNRSNQKRWNCSISKFFLQFNYFLRNTLVKCFSINLSNSYFYIKTKQNTQLGMSYKWKSYSELFKAFFILNGITRFERNINIVKDDVEIKITKKHFYFFFVFRSEEESEFREFVDTVAVVLCSDIEITPDIFHRAARGYGVSQFKKILFVFVHLK